MERHVCMSTKFDLCSNYFCPKIIKKGHSHHFYHKTKIVYLTSSELKRKYHKIPIDGKRSVKTKKLVNLKRSFVWKI